jgi:signal transduction histidine kinase
MQNVREEERTRIACEIHDTTEHGLSGLKNGLISSLNELVQQENLSEREKLYMKIQLMYTLLEQIIHSAHDVSPRLRPLILDNLGLVTAIKWQMEKFQQKTRLTYNFSPTLENAIQESDIAVLFRISQECLAKIIRHANATQVTVKLEQFLSHILLEVNGNVIGIDMNVVKEMN